MSEGGIPYSNSKEKDKIMSPNNSNKYYFNHGFTQQVFCGFFFCKNTVFKNLFNFLFTYM